MGVFAEFERAIIRERVLAGIERAKASGTKSGRRFGRPAPKDGSKGLAKDCSEFSRATSDKGHFRPIQRGFAMSGYPPEADVGTAGICEYTP
jgi:DNA invertase Pin-like site-specific DNA recombinase